MIIKCIECTLLVITKHVTSCLKRLYMPKLKRLDYI